VQKIQNFAHNLIFKIVNFDDFWSVFHQDFSKFQTVGCKENKKEFKNKNFPPFL
jgi:hypothetical protein